MNLSFPVCSLLLVVYMCIGCMALFSSLTRDSPKYAVGESALGEKILQAMQLLLGYFLFNFPVIHCTLGRLPKMAVFAGVDESDSLKTYEYTTFRVVDKNTSCFLALCRTNYPLSFFSFSLRVLVH